MKKSVIITIAGLFFQYFMAYSYIKPIGGQETYIGITDYNDTLILNYEYFDFFHFLFFSYYSDTAQINTEIYNESDTVAIHFYKTELTQLNHAPLLISNINYPNFTLLNKLTFEINKTDTILTYDDNGKIEFYQDLSTFPFKNSNLKCIIHLNNKSFSESDRSKISIIQILDSLQKHYQNFSYTKIKD